MFTRQTYRFVNRKCYRISCLNARSVNNKAPLIHDYILSNNLDILAITETWLGSADDEKYINQMKPNGYDIQHATRNGKRGGGVALIYRLSTTCMIKKFNTGEEYTQFEHLNCEFNLYGTELRMSVVYRPPPSEANDFNTRKFLQEEWPKFLREHALFDKKCIIVGDLNLHLDDTYDRNTIRFNKILSFYGMEQHVEDPTHIGGHILDVVITKDCDVSNVLVTDHKLSATSSDSKCDHCAVAFSVDIKVFRFLPYTKPVLW